MNSVWLLSMLNHVLDPTRTPTLMVGRRRRRRRRGRGVAYYTHPEATHRTSLPHHLKSGISAYFICWFLPSQMHVFFVTFTPSSPSSPCTPSPLNSHPYPPWVESYVWLNTPNTSHHIFFSFRVSRRRLFCFFFQSLIVARSGFHPATS
jgi:hypothetical protein